MLMQTALLLHPNNHIISSILNKPSNFIKTKSIGVLLCSFKPRTQMAVLSWTEQEQSDGF